MSMKPHNPIILQVLPSLNQGGVERATLDIAKALGRDFKDVPNYIASAGGAYVKELKDTRHLTLPLQSKNPFVIFLNALRLSWLIQKHGIQVVHARSRAPGWSAWLACKITKVPFLTTYHGAYKERGRFKKLYNSVMARGDVVIAISNFMRRHISSTYPFAKVRLIPEGVDGEWFSPDIKLEKQKESKTILFPSRLTPIKGIFTALEALKFLVESDKTFKLLLIRTGKTSAMQAVDDWIRKYHLESYVEFLEPTSDLRPYYEKSDIVIVPSLVPEALGRVILEAMLMEKIVITSSHGAACDIVTEGETGFFSSPGNALLLTQKIQKVFSLNEAKKTHIGEKARHYVLEHFSLKAMEDATLQLYRDLS